VTRGQIAGVGERRSGDLVNRQDWRICEAVQDGMGSTAFDTGFCAPMEDLSLDIRRYVADRLGDAAVEGR
jgi:glycine betaine catabolism A